MFNTAKSASKLISLFFIYILLYLVPYGVHRVIQLNLHVVFRANVCLQVTMFQ